jgi:hypothetical protein
MSLDCLRLACTVRVHIKDSRLVIGAGKRDDRKAGTQRRGDSAGAAEAGSRDTVVEVCRKLGTSLRGCRYNGGTGLRALT